MYADYGYYVNEYGGKMPEDAYRTAERRSEAYIRYLTRLNGDILAAENDMVKDAVCAVADVCYSDMSAKEAQAAEGRTGPVKSENNDGYSVSFVTEQTDGQTAEEVLRKKSYDAAYVYLLASGWLSRKVRRGNDHECGHHGL